MGNIKFLLLVFFLIVVVVNGCWEEERNALLELQTNIMSSNGELLVDWAGYNAAHFVDCCFWDRVKCSLETGRVIKLDLEADFGTGDGWLFNASLFLPFKSLQVLLLSSQNIIGWTKNEGFSKLRQLPNLKEVDLQYNPIDPKVLLSSLCWISSLEVLKLGVDVDTSFSIPMTYNTNMMSKKCGGLSNLRELWFEGYEINDINILSALGELRNLEKLILDDNNFNSTIFSSLKIFPSLKHLNLAANEINGNVEMNDIIDLSNLEYLDLSDNNIHSFATTKGNKKMTSLRSLLLGSSYSNSSRVIRSLKSFSSLKSLSYKNSNLTSPSIIYALRNLSTVEYLYLKGSSLNDNFLPNIGQMTSLKVLNMPSGGNNGTLPNQGWCELKYIEELDFLNNNFVGTLPLCLGNLTSLRWLSLAGNNLHGNIASHSIWRRLTSLEYLDIADNQFDVPLSFSQFSDHKKLIYLNVGYNTIITDTEYQNWIPNFQLEFFAIQRCIALQKLPSFLHYQYDLRILAIEGNQLQGKFPTWLLENNTRLAAIYGRDNAFSGPLKLPSSVHLHLEAVDVSNNKLNGHIPQNMSLAFPKLLSLNMSHNHLEGPIPSKISGIYLTILDLSVNFLSGEVPGDLAVVDSPQLFYLRLSNNKLKGKIFSEEFRPHVLSFLYLNDNNFEGALPSNVFLSSLITLDASRNNFSGEIPGCTRDNRRLLQLDLSKNHLQGLIPVEICNLKIINVLAISENKISGSIPSCVSSLPLKHIHLQKNQLGGELGHVIFNFSSLITLDLRYNNFAGNIPYTIGSLSNLNYLLLSNNKLEGDIPTQICMLNNLSIVDFSFNKLYGPLPPCLGYLTQTKKDAEISWTYFAENYRGSWLNFVIWMRSKRHYHDSHGLLSDLFLMDVETQVQFSTKKNSYTYKGNILKYMSGIDLSSNRLTGEIPVELGNMSNIHALNLSHNHLNGRIPNTFSNLQEIESLDLSCNRLNGSIPVGLLELNSLAVFSVAYNNLSGAVPDFKAQFGTFNKSSYEGNPFLCGYPLDNKCGMSPKLSNTSNINGDEESSELEDIQCFYIGFVVSFGAILLGLAAALCLNRHWRRAWFRMIEALMFYCYYFVLDNIVTPIKSRWYKNVG